MPDWSGMGSETDGPDYKDALSYFADHLQEISRATLVMYGTVAEEFEETICMRYGVTCLSLLLTYEEAAAKQVDKKEPGATLISAPDEKGHVTRKPFATCSVADMRKALQRLRKPASSAPVPAEEEARVQLYRDAVARRFTKKSRIQVSARNHKGTVLVSLKDIPLEDMEKLIEALMDSLPTGSAPARGCPLAQRRHIPAMRFSERKRRVRLPPLPSRATRRFQGAAL